MNEMNEINEIKLPKGVDRIAVKQHDDRIVIEFIPEEAKFKEGDFVYEDGRTMIVKSYPNNYHANSYPKYSNRVGYNGLYGVDFSSSTFRYATEEEKQLLIDVMKKDGKRWNAEKLEIEDWLEPWSEEPKKGDWAIFWDNRYLMPLKPLIRLYHAKSQVGRAHFDSFGTVWDNAVKWDGTKEQFEKVLRGEIN